MIDHSYTTNTEIENTRCLWEQAVPLMERTTGYYRSILYQLPEAYLEVTWHAHFNVIIKVSRFTDMEHLDTYLQKICIDDLLS